MILLMNLITDRTTGISKRLRRQDSGQRGSIWDINTLSMNVTGTGTIFMNPYDGRLCTVPFEAVEDATNGLALFRSFVWTN